MHQVNNVWFKVVSKRSHQDSPFSPTKKQRVETFLPQMAPFSNLNQSCPLSTSLDQLKLQVDQNKIHEFKECVSKYSVKEQGIIAQFFSTIVTQLEKREDVHIRQNLNEIVSNPLCFVGVKNALEQIVGAAAMQVTTDHSFEFWLNNQLITYVKTFSRKLLAEINSKVFFDAPDDQSSHQIEPIYQWLDVRYGLFGGKYPADANVPLTKQAARFIDEAFISIKGGNYLSFSAWLDHIEDQLKTGDGIPDAAGFFWKLFEVNPGSLDSDLQLELEQISDSDFSPETAQYFALKGHRYIPQRCLIEQLLRLKLSSVHPTINVDEPLLSNPKAPCLRLGIRPQMLELVHGPRIASKEAITNVFGKTDQRHSFQNKEIWMYLHISLKKDPAFLRHFSEHLSKVLVKKISFWFFNFALKLLDDFMLEKFLNFCPDIFNSNEFKSYTLRKFNANLSKIFVRFNCVKQFYKRTNYLMFMVFKTNDWATLKAYLDGINSQTRARGMLDVLQLAFRHGENLNKMCQKVIKENYIPDWRTAKFHGKTLLHFAIQAKNHKMLRWLLYNGADYMQVDDNNKLPIEVLFLNQGDSNEREVFRKFVKKFGAAQQDKDGNTLVHRAVQTGSQPLLLWLIQNNALCFLMNRSGRLPVSYAKRRSPIFKMLDELATKMLRQSSI